MTNLETDSRAVVRFEPVATVGAAQEDRELVADQPATAVGEDRRQAGHARYYWLMLAESHLTAVVREHGPAD